MTNLRTTLAALFVGASSLAIALPATAQDTGADAGVSISGDTGISGGTNDNGMSGTVGADADAGASVDTNGVTASINGDSDADVDATLGTIAANAEGTADTEADVMAQIEAMSDEDVQRLKDRCDVIVEANMQDGQLFEVCSAVLKHHG